MKMALLRTKLYIPQARPELVSRPRLLKQLQAGLHRKLTLISAPAGFGKTALLSDWLASSQQPAAWLSLDKDDNALPRFLAYLIAALQTIAEHIGEDILNALKSPQPPPTETLLTILLNQIAALPHNFILLLDDYHVVESPPIDAALTFLIEHQPPQMHLVIATREDPPLPLARLRASGQLNELRATALRFTHSEAASFLNQKMGLNLANDDIAALETRTEGWIAGLQLAALAVQGARSTPKHEESGDFIKSFTGSHRFVLDYLIEEVLQHQPGYIRDFLLQTSILERLNGSLCDAVRFGFSNSAPAGENGQTLLETLDRANLFIIPLDNERRWFRYHHLLADVLQTRLLEGQADQTTVLHRRASAWYAKNEQPTAAIRHALAAQDFEQAARIAELAWPTMDKNFQFATWLAWVKTLPEKLIRARPVLCAQYAESFINLGDLETGETWLREAERWVESSKNTSQVAGEMVVEDKEQFHTLPARIAINRAYNSIAQGDLSATAKHTEHVIELTSEGDPLRLQANVLLGLIKWARGDLVAAYNIMSNWINSMLKSGNLYFVIASTFFLADIEIAQGLLHEAMKTYRQSLELAAKQDKHIEKITAHHYLGLAMLYYEMDEPEAAAKYLQKSQELGTQSTLIDWPMRQHLALAKLKKTEGDLAATLRLLDKAERLYVRTPVPELRPIAALKAQVYIKQGELSKAQAWARKRNLSVTDALSYRQEFEHITLSRLRIAEYRFTRKEQTIREALELLARLLEAAAESKRNGSVIEILILQALAHAEQGNRPLAHTALKQALALAEPQGYVRIFVDEGAPMASLLHALTKHDYSPNYVNRLQAAFEKAAGKSAITHPQLDPLSKRELEVLTLLRSDLNGPEIARKLMVSLNTLRTHTKNIYSKLGVNNRRAAVRHAEERHLL